MSLKVRVFLEVKRLIQAAQIIVDVTSCACCDLGPSDGSDVDFTVDERSLVLSRTCGCQRRVDLQCEVMPDGCSAVRWVAGDGLRMRLPVTKLPDKPAAGPGVTSEKEEVLFMCASCQTDITRSDGGTISRILPLPSSNWSAAAEQWFCPCKPNRPAMHHGNFAPQLEGDCLQSSDQWIVLCRSVRQDAIVLAEPEDGMLKILCRTCQHCLGTAPGSSSGDTADVLADDVCMTFIRGHVLPVPVGVLSSDQRPDCACFLEDCLSQQLLETSQESGCCKFVLQAHSAHTSPCSEDKDPFDNIACLWLMSSSVDILAVDTWAAASPHSSSKSALQCQQHCKSEKFQQCLKVLYRPVTEESSIEPWLLDAGAQPLCVTSYLADQLMSHLSCSTAALPPSLRSFDGFQVGYLFRLKTS